MSRLHSLFLLLVLALLPAHAFARPGGGQSFGGGSRGSSSSSSSSSGGSRSFSSSSGSSGGRSYSSSSSSGSSGGYKWGSSSSSSSSSGSSSGRSYTSSGHSTSSSGAYGSASSTGSSEPWSSRPGYSYPASSGGGGGGSMGAFFFVIFVIVVVMIGGIGLYHWYSRREDAWESSSLAEASRSYDLEIQRQEGKKRQYASVAEAIRDLHGTDDAFSFALFQDFLYALYAETQTARGARTLDRLSPYLSEDAKKAYDVFPSGDVLAVVVGSMTIEKIRGKDDGEERFVECRVRFESNVSEGKPGGTETAWYQIETWTLRRSADAKSRAPDAARVLGCPSCGAPLDEIVGGKCRHCDATMSPGGFDWFVRSIHVNEREARGPMLTGTTEEVGTDLPTLVADDARTQYQALCERDPNFGWASFLSRLELIFGAFHRGWSEQRLEEVRPYLSDALFHVQRYWIETYQRAHLRNVTEGARIVTVQLAKIARDKYFDAITVRVYASCVDFTVDEKGEVVAGNRAKQREYSEYWTFLRGSSRTGAPRTDPGCPNCGAPIEEINMAGECGHCKVRVTTGEFDWVLSRIEQDEVYSG